MGKQGGSVLRLGSALGCLLGVTALASPAHAGGEVGLDVGGNAALPTGSGSVFAGPNVLGYGGWRITPNHVVGGMLRFYTLFPTNAAVRGLQEDLQLAAYYDLRLGDEHVAQLALGAWLGAGIWTGCVNGDYCGGFGAIFGARIGGLLPVSNWLALTGGLELGAQTGLVNGVGMMFLPGIRLGVLFGIGRREPQPAPKTRRRIGRGL